MEFLLKWERRGIEPSATAARLAPYLSYYPPVTITACVPQSWWCLRTRFTQTHFLRVAWRKMARTGIELPVWVAHHGALEKISARLSYLEGLLGRGRAYKANGNLNVKVLDFVQLGGADLTVGTAAFVWPMALLYRRFCRARIRSSRRIATTKEAFPKIKPKLIGQLGLDASPFLYCQSALLRAMFTAINAATLLTPSPHLSPCPIADESDMAWPSSWNSRRQCSAEP